jgi:hypothetical protein
MMINVACSFLVWGFKANVVINGVAKTVNSRHNVTLGGERGTVTSCALSNGRILSWQSNALLISSLFTRNERFQKDMSVEKAPGLGLLLLVGN